MASTNGMLFEIASFITTSVTMGNLAKGSVLSLHAAPLSPHSFCYHLHMSPLCSHTCTVQSPLVPVTLPHLTFSWPTSIILSPPSEPYQVPSPRQQKLVTIFLLGLHHLLHNEYGIPGSFSWHTLKLHLIHLHLRSYLSTLSTICRGCSRG